MWFDNIAEWSQKKLRVHFLIYGLVYIGLTLIAPIIIVGCKYDLLKSSSTRLTGVGLILVVCVAVFLIKVIKRLLLKLPQDTKNEQIVKFTFLGVYSLILPVLALLLVQLIKQNVDLACETLTWCLGFIIGGIVLDHLTIKYLEAEYDFRQEAKHKLEVNKRIDTLSKK